MKELKDTCDRANDLIAYMYDEMNEAEARGFYNHLHECAQCSGELASFDEVRQSIVSWRDASLGALTPQQQTALVARRSAIAALREFFNWSPLWMKVGVAFASLLFCVSAVLAVAYLKKATPQVVMVPTDRMYSQKELDEQVAMAVKAKELAMKNKRQTEKEPVTDAPPRQKPAMQQRVTSYASDTRSLRKPLTQQERKELAADLGLLSSRDDDDVDSFTDRISPMPQD